MVAGDGGMSKDNGRGARSSDGDVGVAFNGESYMEY